MPYVTVYTCAHCDEVFSAQGKYRRRYCSPKCKRLAEWDRTKGGDKYWRQRCHTVRPIACVTCLSPISQPRSKPRLYCSRKCAPYGEHAPTQRRSFNCAQCGSLTESTQPHAKYCSRECKDRRKSRKSRAGRADCERCGCPFLTANKYKPARFCSDVCRSPQAQKPFRYSRPAGPTPPLLCEFCELWMPGGHGCKRFCSELCGRYARGVSPTSIDVYFGDCPECGDSFTSTRPNTKFCSDRCAKKLRKRQRRYLKRAATGGDYGVTLRAVAKRDDWRCHLCGGKTNARYDGGRDRDPTIDHLVPVSEGGGHTWENVALAHNKCNWERGATGAAQLRLVG